ncbi:hypothetical protein QR680_012260 [Steinernema hermaphroditum]|uniref:MITD1 C-terminal phospholipase D-like domain-containing protein n=1 Tax=Steinernema hermaphroditum TaxID=289476 RepID=A0AA39I460_9BILA|nr:hypothetical protein QR680_012260 [Steinernema hermaphroditum]
MEKDKKSRRQGKRGAAAKLKSKLSTSFKNICASLTNLNISPWDPGLSPPQRIHRKEHIIAQDSKGHDYSTVYRDCFDATLTWIFIEEPFLVDSFSIGNFKYFCATAKKFSPNLTKVTLVSRMMMEKKKENEKVAESLEEKVDKLKDDLKELGLEMDCVFDKDLHDRSISFSNGWFVKSGRGLHYFLTEEKNYAKRKCRKTSLDFFFCV